MNATNTKPPRGKNIVILCDGTGQRGGTDPDKNSNVYKLFLHLHDRSKRQIVYYDAGVGARSSRLHKIVAGATGGGFYSNVKEAYRFIHQNFEAGDKLYLIGFSRGAATVRSLASIIHHFGILPRNHDYLIDRAFTIYRTKDNKAKAEKAKTFIANNKTMWTDIHFLGVWDTVRSLGIPKEFLGISIKWLDSLLQLFPPFQHSFHELDLKDGTIHAHQALAIDEERKLFLPEIWSQNSISNNKKLKTCSQVWFPGVHSDIGGSYEEAGLADIALEWMVNKAIDIELYKGLDTNPNCKGKLHNPQEGFSKLHPDKVRFWPEGEGNPVVHQSVIDRHNDKSMNYKPWIIEGGYLIEEPTP